MQEKEIYHIAIKIGNKIARNKLSYLKDDLIAESIALAFECQQQYPNESVGFIANLTRWRLLDLLYNKRSLYYCELNDSRYIPSDVSPSQSDVETIKMDIDNFKFTRTERIAIAMVLDGYKVGEIAIKLNKDHSTVSKAIAKGIEKIKEKYNESTTVS